jgi:putative membrane protein
LFLPLYILFWAAIIVGIVWLVMWAARMFPGRTHAAADSALAILNERFARGEIDQAEYEQRKAALRKTP